MKIIAICAIDQEAVKFELPNAEILFIQGGVGKTVSAFHLTKAICEIEPDIVINFGTAGTVKHNVDDIIVCNRFVDRDLRKVSIDCIQSEYQFEPIKGLPFLEK
ncbi:MAG: nucleosidase, partial [bacterium]|nr:nucleosidase [Candidatus Limimorpha equi]